MTDRIIGKEAQEKNLRKRQLQIGQVRRLKEDGFNSVEIAKKLGISESTVRSHMNVIEQADANRDKQ